MTVKRIRLLNSFEPVTRHYRDLIPLFLIHGYEVEVVISQAQYRTGRDLNWVLPNVIVARIPAIGINKLGSLIGKLGVMFTYTFVAAIRTLLGPPVERNLFFTQPPLFVLWGLILRVLRGQPYTQILMDLYPEIAVRSGILPIHSPLTYLLQRLAHIALRHADSVIVIGRCMADRVTKIGVEPKRIKIIPNWANTDIVKPIPHHQNAFRTQQRWQTKFVLMYAGNIGLPQYFDDLLEVARLFRRRTDFVLAFVGDGMRRDELQSYAERYSLDNTVFIPFQDQDQQSMFLSAADLHYVSLRAGIEGLAVPSKTYSILAAGRPVLYQGSAEGEIAQLVCEHDIGAYIGLNSVNDLEQAVKRYLDSPELVERQGRNARQLAECCYNHRNAQDLYRDTLGIGTF